MDDQTKKLLTLYERLRGRERATLVAFAEFLCQRQDTENTATDCVRPMPIERPEDETVPQALQRLRATYAMLDVSDLLGEASELMSGHIMQGREAASVIDDLQDMFERHYQRMINK